ncbi:MAG: hypothetical protein IPK28_05705 [Devosia sp.]|nr:hypothetical protein [Devosia sp.]
MAERLTSHLDGMKTAAANAVAFLDGMPLDLFVADPKTQSAVAMCLALVGEAANRIAADSPEFIAAHPSGRGTRCEDCAIASFTATILSTFP